MKVYQSVSTNHFNLTNIDPLIGNQNKIDSRVFWTCQYIMGFAWVAMAVVNFFVFSISNMTVCIVGAVLSITNTMGYIKCDKQHQKKMGSFLATKAKNNLSSAQMAKLGMYAMKNGAGS